MSLLVGVGGSREEREREKRGNNDTTFARFVSLSFALCLVAGRAAPPLSTARCSSHRTALVVVLRLPPRPSRRAFPETATPFCKRCALLLFTGQAFWSLACHGPSFYRTAPLRLSMTSHIFSRVPLARLRASRSCNTSTLSTSWVWSTARIPSASRSCSPTAQSPLFCR